MRIASAVVCVLLLSGAARLDAGQESNHDAVVSAKISRPVNPTRDLPALSIQAGTLVRSGRPVPYTARVFASLDGGAYAQIARVQSEKGVGGNVRTLISDAAVRPGFHAIRLKVEFEAPSVDGYALPPIYYAIYNPESTEGAQVRALVYGPASALAGELDPQLGDEPFAVWLADVLSNRRGERDIAPEWMSDFCDKRTADPTRALDPTAICSVVAFQARGDLVELWFRTADINATEHGVEWVPLAPAKFEGMTLSHVLERRGLAALPALLDTPPESRSAGDLSILPDQIVYAADQMFGAPGDVTVRVRNIGEQDLHKVTLMIAWGVDPNVRPSTRQVVVDVPAQQSTDVKVKVGFPNGYGFIMAQAMPISEHSPFGIWSPDPTPHDDCALRVINAQLAPPKYKETLLEGTGPGCTGK